MLRHGDLIYKHLLVAANCRSLRSHPGDEESARVGTGYAPEELEFL